MILEKQTESLIHQEGELQDSIGMSLDLDSAQVLMQMLSKNLYSDSVGSTVRECASNALDSHRRAGTTDPIIVSFRRNKDDNYEFSVEDFGTGLDADDVKNIISKYGKSTKRNSTTELGMMGLGFKAPLAYCSSFYFVCRKDGMERKYMMYEGEEVNTIDLLHEAPTTERNGVKVIVPVKYHDRNEFSTKIKEQLAYFESVYFDVDGMENDFTIYRHEHFQFSPLCSDSHLHVCLDNVYYPLDFKKLGIDNVNFPVGVRFSLTDGLFPTPNRESIRYTQEAKTIILNKLALVADFFVNKFNENISDSDDPSSIIDYYKSNSRYLPNPFGSGKLNIGQLMNFSTVKLASPQLKGVKLLNMAKIAKIDEKIFGEYEIKFQYYGGRMRTSSGRWSYIRHDRLNDGIYWICGDKLSGNKKDYLKHMFVKDKYREQFIIRKVRDFQLGNNKGYNANTYHSILNLQTYPKHQWRQLIQEFQTMLKMLTDKFKSVDDVQIPQEWLDSRKKTKVIVGGNSDGKRRLKIKGEMVCKVASALERWVEGKNCKWVSTIYDLAKFHKNPYTLVYGKQEDMDKMDKLFEPFGKSKKSIRFAVMSERELKVIEKLELHNLIPFNKFMEGKNKPFQRVATACLIDQLSDQYRAVFRNGEILKDISIDLFNKIESLNSYKEDNFYSCDDKLRDVVINHAKEINMFDGPIYSTYLEIKQICEKFPFMNAMLGSMHRYGSEPGPMDQALIDLFKYHKHRIDWKNYKIKFNEDLSLEQTLTEETVETLIN